MVKDGEVAPSVAAARVREFGEEAGKVLEQDKVNAAAARKTKVTRRMIAPEISVKTTHCLVELVILAGINENGTIMLSGEFLNEVVEINHQ